jgi:hypothetical protein
MRLGRRLVAAKFPFDFSADLAPALRQSDKRPRHRHIAFRNRGSFSFAQIDAMEFKGLFQRPSITKLIPLQHRANRRETMLVLLVRRAPPEETTGQE